MGFPAAQVGEIPAETLQRGTSSIESIQGFIGDFHNFRSLKADGSSQRHIHAHKLANHGLVAGFCGILVALAHAVVGKQFALAAHFFHQKQIGIESLGRLNQLTGIGRKRFNVLVQSCQGFFPGCIAGIKVFQRPGIFYRNFGTVFILSHMVPPECFLLLYHAKGKKQFCS